MEIHIIDVGQGDIIKYHEGGFSHVEGSDPRMTKVLMDEVFD
jgi:hypothetical protein